jgi:threonine dehydrogenase-like Zn-dependent dehydrogenase
VTHHFPLEQWEAAFARAESREEGVLKVCLDLV